MTCCQSDLNKGGGSRNLSPATVAIFLVRGYQILISPLKGATCRFHPSCSQYALEALSRYGLFKGGWLAMGRVLRCHPLNPGGYDPVR